MLKRSSFAVAAFVAALAAVVFSSQARADAKAADYTGTRKWTATMRNNTVDFTAKLKQDGEKVTGTIGGGHVPETEIKDAKVEHGELSFKNVRSRNGNDFTT